MRMSSLTLEKTVGSMKNPFTPRALPPHSSLAPSVMPLWMNSSTRLWCSRLICGGGGQTYSHMKKWAIYEIYRANDRKTDHSFWFCAPHLWSLLSHGVKGAANYPPLCSLHAPPDELVIYGLLHIDAGACRATLPCVEKHTLVGFFYSQIHWGNGEICAG